MGRIQMPPSAPTNRIACLEVDRHELQERRDTEAEIDEALALPCPADRADRSRTRASARPIPAGAAQRCRDQPQESRIAQHREQPAPARESSTKRARPTIDARNGRVNGPMSGRLCQLRAREPANLQADPVFNTCGGGSTSRCSARHNAVRTAVLSGWLLSLRSLPELVGTQHGLPCAAFQRNLRPLPLESCMRGPREQEAPLLHLFDARPRQIQRRGHEAETEKVSRDVRPSRRRLLHEQAKLPYDTGNVFRPIDPETGQN